MVNTQTAYNQEDPVITTLDDGGFVILLESEIQDGSEYGMFGQRLDQGGNLTGSEFQVNTFTDNFQWAPAVAPLSGGGFVAVWQSAGQDGSFGGIYGQLFSINSAESLSTKPQDSGQTLQLVGQIELSGIQNDFHDGLI